MIIDYIIVAKRVHVISLKPIFKPIIASLIMVVAMIILPHIHVLIDIAIGGIVYIIVLLLIRGVDNSELQIVLNMFKRGETK